MREITNSELKARVSIDEEDQVRQINHSEAPWTSREESPLRAALDYLQQMAGELQIAPREFQNAREAVTFTEPRAQDVEYRLGKEKGMFDSSTIIFNQTYLNVPVWRAAITLTLKHNPNRVVLVTNTSERGMDAKLPSPERIHEHRTLFALAAADRQLRSLGLGDQMRAAGLAEENEQPKTAAFIRRVLGPRPVRAAAALEEPPDEARALRGRFFVYRYDEGQRLPKSVTDPLQGGPEDETESLETSHHKLPVLPLPAVDPSIANGAWRLVSEVTFSFTTPEHGHLNWRALVDVQTDAVLLLEPLVAGLDGLVFQRDPITSTGDSSNTPDRSNSVLNPLRTTVELPNLQAPVNTVQQLRGRFAVVADLESPSIAPPTKPANTPFNYDVRTNDFAAVNAYYHTDRFFSLVESLGFPIATYFDNTTFPVPVDHRDMGNAINAHCVGNGNGGIGHAGYALNDLSDTTNPIGRACDSRVHLHELGGHGILYEHVDHPNFGFAHSAGDSLSAILHDPDSRAPDRFRYAPWNPQNTRRFDRAVAQGWAWGGVQDDRGYQSEEILCTTMFRVYCAIGGDSTDLGQRQFASRMMMYLILRAISTLTPATNPRNAIGFANALMAADLLNWTSEGVSGGAYNKVIRWSFEKQGLYQRQGAPQPVRIEGEPPEVDVYIDDGRGGAYQHQPTHWNNPSVWNRRTADGQATHQEPAAGVPNYAYVKIKNRGTRPAQNVRVRGFHHRVGGGTSWPDDFEPLTTAELVAGSLAARDGETKTIGPFEWMPNIDAAQHDSLLMIVSAIADPSNVDHFTAGESIPEWRLVPNDNNLGLRNVILTGLTDGEMRAEAAGGNHSDRAMAAEAAEAGEWGMRRHAAIANAAMERLQSANARAAILGIFAASGEVSLGEAARWADKLKGRNRPRDPATQRFLAERRNRGHGQWHYVNLPLGLDGYDRVQHPEFTRDDDVVQTILLAIESLQNPGQHARFEQIIALRWLAHLIGDLHQPIHVGCGYIAEARTSNARLVFSPDEAIGLSSDKGGGELLLPIGVNLHSFWDSRLGPDIIPDALNAESDDALVESLAKAAAVQALAEDAEIADQIISWANASLAAARQAYQGLHITGYQPRDEGDYPVDWEGEEAYTQRNAPIVSDRMSAAVANLAGLLDAIWP